VCVSRSMDHKTCAELVVTVSCSTPMQGSGDLIGGARARRHLEIEHSIDLDDPIVPVITVAVVERDTVPVGYITDRPWFEVG